MRLSGWMRDYERAVDESVSDYIFTAVTLVTAPYETRTIEQKLKKPLS